MDETIHNKYPTYDRLNIIRVLIFINPQLVIKLSLSHTLLQLPASFMTVILELILFSPIICALCFWVFVAVHHVFGFFWNIFTLLFRTIFLSDLRCSVFRTKSQCYSSWECLGLFYFLNVTVCIITECVHFHWVLLWDYYKVTILTHLFFLLIYAYLNFFYILKNNECQWSFVYINNSICVKGQFVQLDKICHCMHF